ncbi:MAG: hypothetical protein ACO3FE_21285, partial [Planctomycetaceae bacterium]
MTQTNSALGMLLENGNQIQIQNMFIIGQGMSTLNNTCGILGWSLEGTRIEMNQLACRTHYGVIIEGGWEAGVYRGIGPVFLEGNAEGPSVPFRVRRREGFTHLANNSRVSGVNIVSSVILGGPNVNSGTAMSVGAWFSGAANCSMEPNWSVSLPGPSKYGIQSTVSRERDASDNVTLVLAGNHTAKVGEYVLAYGLSGNSAASTGSSGSFNTGYKILEVSDTLNVQSSGSGPTVVTTADAGGSVIWGSWPHIIESDCRDIAVPKYLINNQQNGSQNAIDLSPRSSSYRPASLVMRTQTSASTLISLSGITAGTSRIIVSANKDDRGLGSSDRSTEAKAAVIVVKFTITAKGAAGTRAAVSLSNPTIVNLNTLNLSQIYNLPS